MGGIGSGRHYQEGKNITSDMKSLDIRELHQQGLLLPDMDFSWHWTRNGEKVPQLRICTAADHIIFSYNDLTRSGEWKFMEYTIYLEWTDCNLGGQRPWFRCPSCECDRRVAILYSDSILACRHCHKLVYPCQRENDNHRSMRRADTIRQRLGWKLGIANPGDGKPKGMHWRTFQRLKEKHDVFANATWTTMVLQLMQMERRLERKGIDLDDWNQRDGME